MSSTDYWLLTAWLCPACRGCDHAHCDPDREDCPSEVCTCRAELIPEPREAGDS